MVDAEASMVLQSELIAKSRELAVAVDEERLWDRHLRMATFGERPDGGVNRQALSYNDGLARVQLKEWAESLGYACSIDA
ncbi:MAG: hypothetical protein NTZ72_00675, partial [Afipia sp.]|nr:hypothetical protein [Afipia sp.]